MAHGFEEYTRLYRDSWSDPVMRWLLSTISSAMVFDDHDVYDDWNISQAWVEDMWATDWWEKHIVGALASYWVYQHLGNMSPEQRAEDELWAKVRDADDAWDLLREFALRNAQDRRIAVELRARARRHAPGDDRLALRPGARAGRAVDARRGRVGLGRGAHDGRLRPPPRCYVTAVAARARHALARGVERGALRRSVGRARRAARREVAPRRRPRALGRVPGIVRAPRGSPATGRGRRARRAAGGDRDPLGGCPPCLPQRGRLPAWRGRAQRRLPGRLLADAQPARLAPSAVRSRRRGHASRTRSGDCSGMPPEWPILRCAGATSATRRGSTTRSQSSWSMAARCRWRSTRRCRARTGPSSSGSSNAGSPEARRCRDTEPMSQENVEAVRRGYDAFNEGGAAATVDGLGSAASSGT